VFLTILTATLSIMGQTDPIKDAFNTILTPARYVANAVSDAIDGFESYFKAIDDYKAENESLKAENESLKAELVEGEAAREEMRVCASILR